MITKKTDVTYLSRPFPLTFILYLIFFFRLLPLSFFLSLQYIHDQDIAHRDLKLENIIVMNKKDLRVKIADFGLATFYRGKPFHTMCGTQSYGINKQKPTMYIHVHANKYSFLIILWNFLFCPSLSFHFCFYI